MVQTFVWTYLVTYTLSSMFEFAENTILCLALMGCSVPALIALFAGSVSEIADKFIFHGLIVVLMWASILHFVAMTFFEL